MGFFRDFKDDMIPEEDSGKMQEEATKKAENEEEKKMSDFEDANVDKDLLSQIFAEDADGESGNNLFADSSDEKKEEFVQEEIPDFILPKEEEADGEKAVENGSSEDDVDAILKEAAQEKPAEDVKPAEAPVDAEVTVITKGTTINGGISSDGSLEIMGTITGDVDCLGKLSVYGQISGNVTAADVIVKTKRLEGNIESEGSVEVAVGTVIIGDIIGTSASISGAVKGNIDVNGPVTIDSTAIVRGSIKAKSIQVNNGAVVDGYCSLNYAGVDLDDFFEEK